MKKVLFSVLAATVIAQFFVPSYIIWEKYDVLKNGTEVKIRVSPLDPYDAFRGRYVSLWYEYDLTYEQREGKYGVLKTDDNGFAVVSRVTNEKPEQGLYLVSKDEDYFNITLDRYYMEETLAPEAEQKISESAEVYVTVKIKNDKAVLSGLYIDGKPAEEILSEQSVFD